MTNPIFEKAIAKRERKKKIRANLHKTRFKEQIVHKFVSVGKTEILVKETENIKINNSYEY